MVGAQRMSLGGTTNAKPRRSGACALYQRCLDRLEALGFLEVDDHVASRARGAAVVLDVDEVGRARQQRRIAGGVLVDAVVDVGARADAAGEVTGSSGQRYRAFDVPTARLRRGNVAELRNSR